MNAGRFLIRVTILLIAVSACGFADGLSAPRVTLSVVDEPLTAVLERIAEQTGVSIVMTNEVAGKESISMRVRNAELENALDQALSSYNYTLSFSADQNVISKVVVAVQEKKEGMAVQDKRMNAGLSLGATASVDGLVHSGFDEFAQAYYRGAVAKQKPIVPPEGLAQADVDQAFRELRQMQNVKGEKK